jgi:UPF0755 protein
MGIRAKRRQANLAARFFIFVFLLAALLVAALLAFVYLEGAAERALGPGAEDLSPAERAVLLGYLSARAGDLTRPAGSNPAPVLFTVEPGATAGAVAERLAAQGLVHDAQLLTYFLRYRGLDGRVEAGDFILRQTMTIPQVALALTDASARETWLRVTEGWRREQIAAALAAHGAFASIATDFDTLTGPNSPRPPGDGLLASLPPGASLEGYLFPDTYLLRPGASASEIIAKMLANFQNRLPAGYAAEVESLGLTVHQAVTVASLIEREAVVDDERPLIASVIYNRLGRGQWLEIDATVQYALGASDNWWPRLAGVDLRAVLSPYNTYAGPGLPPGPIANPGLASLLAAVRPAQSDYLFYRALCDGSGRHAFAITFEQHLANACQ